MSSSATGRWRIFCNKVLLPRYFGRVEWFATQQQEQAKARKIERDTGLSL
jgi:hypothetical protein